MRYETWTPELVFSAHNSEVELLEAKLRTAEIVSALSSASTWLLGNAVVPVIFGESIAWLIRFCGDAEGCKNRFIEAKIETANVHSALSLYQAKIRGIQGRLDRLLREISRSERELEIVPAFMACQEIMTLFRDPTYPFWIKPEISSPLLVSFAAIYVAVCQMTVELFDSYRSDVAKEIVILGNVVDDYRKRFLCFRLYQIKYPIFSQKNIIDKYDEKHRTTNRSKTKAKFDCYCLHRQNYSASLIEVYGSFFDSVKAAIVDSGLLPQRQRQRNEWCTEHKRCFFNSEIQKKCFCKYWYSFDEASMNGNSRSLISSEYTWRYTWCDKCEQQIVGERYICTSCFHYDLCKYCIADQVHIAHDFIRMIKTNTLKSAKRSVVHRFVSCDGCEESPLCGRRHKCTQCENYDLCTSCHDNQVHEHDTFEEIANSKSAVKKSEKCIEAVKNTQQCQSEAVGEASVNYNENSELESEADDMKKVCLLCDEDPEVPFSGTITCQENTIFYAINISGRIPQQPHRFEVNLWLEDKIVLHFNPRWDQEKIVVNTDDTEAEDYALFSSLVPDEDFRLEILFEDGSFQIKMNDEHPINFAQRIIDEELIFKVEVSGDVVLKSVTFNLYNSA